MRITAFTADPLALTAYGPLLRADGSVGLTLTSARPDKNGVVGRAKEITTKEEADALRGFWSRLADGGQVVMPLERQMWGDDYGLVTDKYGISWHVNIAGGALGTDAVGDGDRADWEWMYRVNVLGTLTMCQAFLPMLRAHGEGTVLNLTSTAAVTAYEGGAGYNAAKMGQHGLTGALRLEEAEHNVRVIEVLPGMVHTEEFSRNRLGGDQSAADAVYAGVEKPLTAEDVAEVCVHAVELPHHVNLDQIVMRPVAQAAQHKVIRR